MDLSDDELWRRCRAQDDGAALGELFRRHARALHRHAFRASGDWARADDAVSVVFLEAWRRRSQVTIEPGLVRAWLFGVAVNVLRNEGRSRRRVRDLLARVEVGSTGTSSDDADAIDARLDDEARARTLLPVVGRLPRHEREVVALVWWSDLTYEEAAVALGVPVGTVRSRVSRARTRLARLGVGPAATDTASASDDDPSNLLATPGELR